MNRLKTKADLEQVFLAYHETVYRSVLFGVNFDKDLAQDLTQETFIRAWRYRESFDSDKAQIKTWLVRIARNLCLDHFQKLNTEISLEVLAEVASLENEENKIHQNLMLEIVLTKMQQLSERDRVILTLRYVEGFELKEIAQSLRLPYFLVKVAANRAFKRLQQLCEHE